MIGMNYNDENYAIDHKALCTAACVLDPVEMGDIVRVYAHKDALITGQIFEPSVEQPLCDLYTRIAAPCVHTYRAFLYEMRGGKPAYRKYEVAIRTLVKRISTLHVVYDTLFRDYLRYDYSSLFRTIVRPLIRNYNCDIPHYNHRYIVNYDLANRTMQHMLSKFQRVYTWVTNAP
jgi:hypothetical protein